MKRLAVFALVLASTLASCSRTDNGYQGWIEANLIFVAPDEVGRVQTLAVREGDSIKAGQPLFTVDDDLQQVDLAQVKAALANAQQSFDRAQQLAKTGSGTQKDLDTATAVLRDAQARLNSSQTRLSRRQVFSPVTGTVQDVLPNPKLLLLDEPTAGVDPKARRDFWDEIHKLAAEGLTVLVSTHYMDEAERCHEITYIAFGEVLTRGTVKEVVANSHLTTFTVSAANGEQTSTLAGELKDRPGIDMVTAFGTSLHVSGRDRGALEAAIAPYRQRKELEWQRAAPSLEDVFIDLIAGAKDNFQ
jgi:ABC-type branched-subunit amino acid transport system ATPase component